MEQRTSRGDDEFGPIIFAYTREMAIDDGTLVAVDPRTSKEVGIRFPVALTAAAWVACVEWDQAKHGTHQDESGRLWDVLWMARHAMRKTEGSECEVRVYVLAPGGHRGAGHTKPTLRTLKAVCGPGDDLEPVITIMLPDED